MENLKESSLLEVCVEYCKTSNTIYFSAKNNFNFALHKYFFSRNFIEEYLGAYGRGFYLDLNCNLNLKQFKMKIFE